MPQNTRHISDREASAPTPVRMDGKSFDVFVTGSDTTPRIGFKERPGPVTPELDDFYDEPLELPVRGRKVDVPEPDDFFDEPLELPVRERKAIDPEPEDFFDEPLELPVWGRKVNIPEPDTVHLIDEGDFFDEPLELPVRGRKLNTPEPDRVQPSDDNNFFDEPLELPVRGRKEAIAPEPDNFCESDPDEFFDEPLELPVRGRKVNMPEPSGASGIAPQVSDSVSLELKREMVVNNIEKSSHYITGDNLTTLHQIVKNSGISMTYTERLDVLSRNSNNQHVARQQLLLKLKYLQSELCKVEESLEAHK